MKFHVLTLFPEMIEQAFHTSITGKAVEHGRIGLETVNIRDYTQNKHKKVDDYPYGGGAGMLMQAQPVYDAYESVRRRLEQEKDGAETGRLRCIYVTPQGTVFTQEMAQELAQEEHLAFLCGHYEGIDERVLEEIVTDYVSIGDYVLTGGELPALVMMDAIARMVPAVLHNEESAQTESFHRNLLEHPHYSRPEIWHGKTVPEVLLSGDHKKIADWRQAESVRRTRERRPDLYAQYQRTEKIIDRLLRDKVLHIDMTDSLNRDSAKILYAEAGGTVLQEKQSGLLQLSVWEPAAIPEILGVLREKTLCGGTALIHQEALLRALQEEEADTKEEAYLQAVYTRKVSFPAVKKIILRKLDEKTAAAELNRAGIENQGLLLDTFYGAVEGDRIMGFIGLHQSGSIGVLYVGEEYRRRGIAQALETDCINRLQRAGRAAYCRIRTEDTAALCLQEKLGLRISRTPVLLWKKQGEACYRSRSEQ